MKKSWENNKNFRKKNNLTISLNLSRNRKMESKIKKEFGFIKNDKNYIKVYQSMQREKWGRWE